MYNTTVLDSVCGSSGVSQTYRRIRTVPLGALLVLGCTCSPLWYIQTAEQQRAKGTWWETGKKHSEEGEGRKEAGQVNKGGGSKGMWVRLESQKWMFLLTWQLVSHKHGRFEIALESGHHWFLLLSSWVKLCNNAHYTASILPSKKFSIILPILWLVFESSHGGMTCFNPR